MTEIQEIDLYIRSDGSVKVEVRGVKGQACLGVTRELEQQLGGRIVERNYTDEYSQAEQGESLDAKTEQRQQ